jgi:enamine deaminase RidA (YjgF/YER057c/UK114 family)
MNQRIPAALLFSGLITPRLAESGEVVTATAQVDAQVAAAREGSPMLDIPADRAMAQAWVALENLGRWLAERDSGYGRVVRLRILLRDLRDLRVVDRVARLFFEDWRPALSVVEFDPAGVDADIAVAVDAVAVPAVCPEPVRLDGQGVGAVRAGDLIFVESTVGRDPATGRLVRGVDDVATLPDDLRPSALDGDQTDAITAQSWQLFDNIRALLAEHGCGLADVVKVNGWLGFAMDDYRPLAAVRSVLQQRHGQHTASGAIQVQQFFPAAAVVAFEAVAVVGQAPTAAASPSEMSPIYADTRSGGGYVWTSGEVPVEFDPPAAVTGLSQLPGAGDWAAGSLAPPARSEIQARAVYRQLAAHLAQAGCQLQDAVHQTVFLRAEGDVHGALRAAAGVFGTAMPATTVIPVRGVSPFRESEVEIELVARAQVGPSDG